MGLAAYRLVHRTMKTGPAAEVDERPRISEIRLRRSSCLGSMARERSRIHLRPNMPNLVSFEIFLQFMRDEAGFVAA